MWHALAAVVLFVVGVAIAVTANTFPVVVVGIAVGGLGGIFSGKCIADDLGM